MRIRVAAALGFYRGDAGRYEYCAEFVRLLQEAPCRPTRRNLSLRQNLEPEGGFVRLLQRAVDARDELRSRSGATRRSVIGADTGSRSTELIADIVTFVGRRQRSYEREDIQGKL